MLLILFRAVESSALEMLQPPEIRNLGVFERESSARFSVV
jgi:hypothetical protein